MESHLKLKPLQQHVQWTEHANKHAEEWKKKKNKPY